MHDCYGKFYNEHRPHQTIDIRILTEYHMTPKRQGSSLLSKKYENETRKEFLVGFLKSYQGGA